MFSAAETRAAERFLEGKARGAVVEIRSRSGVAAAAAAAARQSKRSVST